jgi:tetratricopeptide (TPR) repeat protein
VAELVARASQYRQRHQQADNDLAIAVYRQALERSPDEVEAQIGLSLALSQSVTKFNRSDAERDEALELARRALEAAPDRSGAHYAHALALDSRGQVDAAIEEYLRADALGGGVSGLASAAYLFQIQGRLARALEADLEVYDRFPEAHYVEVQIGATLGLLGFEDAAVVWLERADTLRPDNVFAALALAQFRLSGGRLDEAERVARHALEKGIHRSELHGVLGRVAELRGQDAEAATHYRQAIEVSARNCSAASRLWQLDPESPDAGRAVCFGPPATAFGEPNLEDEYPAAWITAAVAYARSGDAANALAFLDGAIELGYRDADWLQLDPMLQGLRSDPELVRRVERIRGLIEAERATVLSAPWLPHGLLAPTATEGGGRVER